MATELFVSQGAYLLTVLLVLAVIWGLNRRKRGSVEKARLKGLEPPADASVALTKPGSRANIALPKIGSTFLSGDEEERSRLQARLLQAGCYGRQAVFLYLGVKAILMLTPWVVGLAVGLLGLVRVIDGVAVGAVLSFLGMMGPGMWLDRRKAERQRACRVGLPDLLDVLVICLEAGLSMGDGLRRVIKEMGSAHPSLRTDLNIVQREMQLGRSAGDALQKFSDRMDLQEVRNLAMTVSQSDRYGGGLVKALRLQTESMRFQRVQQMEEIAQKAGTKMLLPTLLFIFPGIFVILLGPAAMQVSELLGQMKASTAKSEVGREQPRDTTKGKAPGMSKDRRSR